MIMVLKVATTTVIVFQLFILYVVIEQYEIDKSATQAAFSFVNEKLKSSFEMHESAMRLIREQCMK